MEEVKDDERENQQKTHEEEMTELIQDVPEEHTSVLYTIKSWFQSYSKSKINWHISSVWTQ